MQNSEGVANPFYTCKRLSQKYSVLGKVGEGSLSNVYKLRSKRTGKLCALKAFNHLQVKSTRNRRPGAHDSRGAHFAATIGHSPSAPPPRTLFRGQGNFHGRRTHEGRLDARASALGRSAQAGPRRFTRAQSHPSEENRPHGRPPQ